MTKAEWAKLPADYKGVRAAAETETHGAYRFRRCMTHGCTLVNVYITDMKTVEIPKCLDGPRQQKALESLADVWEPLPRGTFTYTQVATAILRITV
ncbi:Uncharacterised protein [Klebsiella pneumoniae]|nr:Uncharacterised protein [Klebsiella pneumoniae]